VIKRFHRLALACALCSLLAANQKAVSLHALSALRTGAARALCTLHAHKPPAEEAWGQPVHFVRATKPAWHRHDLSVGEAHLALTTSKKKARLPLNSIHMKRKKKHTTPPHHFPTGRWHGWEEARHLQTIFQMKAVGQGGGVTRHPFGRRGSADELSGRRDASHLAHAIQRRNVI